MHKTRVSKSQIQSNTYIVEKQIAKFKDRMIVAKDDSTLHIMKKLQETSFIDIQPSKVQYQRDAVQAFSCLMYFKIITRHAFEPMNDCLLSVIMPAYFPLKIFMWWGQWSD